MYTTVKYVPIYLVYQTSSGTVWVELKPRYNIIRVHQDYLHSTGRLSYLISVQTA